MTSKPQPPELDLVYKDVDGTWQDKRFYNELLNNPIADQVLAIQAMDQAIKIGMPQEIAKKLYGIKDIDPSQYDDIFQNALRDMQFKRDLASALSFVVKNNIAKRKKTLINR